MSDIMLLEGLLVLAGLTVLGYWALAAAIQADREAGKKEAARLQRLQRLQKLEEESNEIETDSTKSSD